MSWVTDISHFSGVLDPSSDAPGPARRIARCFGAIVQAATAWLPDDRLDTALGCRRRPRRRACPGRIRLVRIQHDDTGDPVDDERILWDCPACGDNGVIRNWKGTQWTSGRRWPPTGGGWLSWSWPGRVRTVPRWS